MWKSFLACVVTMGLLLTAAPSFAADELVSFEPVRAPSKGPEDAPVTIIEIADFT